LTKIPVEVRRDVIKRGVQKVKLRQVDGKEEEVVQGPNGGKEGEEEYPRVVVGEKVFKISEPAPLEEVIGMVGEDEGTAEDTATSDDEGDAHSMRLTRSAARKLAESATLVLRRSPRKKTKVMDDSVKTTVVVKTHSPNTADKMMLRKTVIEPTGESKRKKTSRLKRSSPKSKNHAKSNESQSELSQANVANSSMDNIQQQEGADQTTRPAPDRATPASSQANQFAVASSGQVCTDIMLPLPSSIVLAPSFEIVEAPSFAIVKAPPSEIILAPSFAIIETPSVTT
jgi:hypothetical protein